MKAIKKTIQSTFLLSTLFLMVNCGGPSNKPNNEEDIAIEREDPMEIITNSEDDNDQSDLKSARAVIHSASASNLTGTMDFIQVDPDSVKFELTISNTEPGEHAVHLHENGACTPTDASDAGGHWNPTNTKHGKRGTEPFHKGDITNVTVDEDGNGSLTMTIYGWSIGGSANSNILNKAVIIHAGADDFTSQPSGDAGNRIGCGVIEEK